MDYLGLLASFLFFIGIIGALIFGSKGYERTAWCLSLVACITSIIMAVFMARDGQQFVNMYSAIFQPTIARNAVNVAILLLLSSGAVGMTVCLVAGIKWFIRRSRSVQKPYVRRGVGMRK